MTQRVLLVDDDVNLLQAVKRNLRKQFNIETAESGKKGLEIVENGGPFAVIIADMQMPEMDGITFLSKVKALRPDSVRIMLTGNADLETPINAVNEGNIFRFLTKPCPQELLIRSIASGLRQYELVTAEKELLGNTLKGSIKILIEVLSLANPLAFSRASRIRQMASMTALEMNVENLWRIEMAAMLSQIGCIAVPEKILLKTYNGQRMSREEQIKYRNYSQVSHDLIKNIPRMEPVADIIKYQEKLFNGNGFPEDSIKGEDIPLEARILKPVLDFDILTSSGMEINSALIDLKNRSGWYDPQVLKALEQSLKHSAGAKRTQLIHIEKLKERMVLASNIYAINGSLLVAKGQEISSYTILLLRNYDVEMGVRQPVQVYV